MWIWIKDQINEIRLRHYGRIALDCARAGDRTGSEKAWACMKAAHYNRSAAHVARMEKKMGVRNA